MPEVEAAMKAAINKFRELGAEIIEVSLPMIKHVKSATMAIMMTEMYSNHEKWLETELEQYGPDVRMFLESSRDIPASIYLQSQRARQLIVNDFLNALSGIDILLTPTTPITAPRADDNASVFRLNSFTVPTNLTGLPSLSMPCGFSPSGLPINMQLIGRPFEEATVLGIGNTYEMNTDWHKRHPDL